MTDENSASERVGALVTWAAEEFGGYPLAEHVDCLVKLEVPLQTLMSHLRSVSATEHPRSLAYFVSGAGIGRLHELESESRRNRNPRKGGGASLSELLPGYDAAAAS